MANVTNNGTKLESTRGAQLRELSPGVISNFLVTGGIRISQPSAERM
jgi:hypothetical protein